MFGACGRITLTTCVVAALAVQLPAAASRRQTGPTGNTGDGVASPAKYQALVNRYCVTCHSERLKTGKFVLESVPMTGVGAEAEVWEKVIRKVRGGFMPPPGRPRPDLAATDEFASWLEGEIDRAAALSPDPGRTEPLHRLNRAEYQNVVRDLLAVQIDARAWLPADDGSFGFDNNARSLRISQSLIERYLQAARHISRLAVGGTPVPSTQVFHVSPHVPQSAWLEGLPFGTRGGTVISYSFPVDAEYTFKLEVSKKHRPALREELELLIDNEVVATLPVTHPQLMAGEEKGGGMRREEPLEVTVPVRAGRRQVGVTFRDRMPKYGVQLREPFERPYENTGTQTAMLSYGPRLELVEISGPYDVTGPGDTVSRQRIFTCHPSSPSNEEPCATEVLSTLARRAYRRPVGSADMEPLLAAFREGRADGTFDRGIETALRALVVNVNFLYRQEPEPASGKHIYRVSGLSLASRLSFFLWSSIPDDELLDAAVSGGLEKPAILERQVRRMLADRRSRALVENFASQWLYLRNLEARRRSCPIRCFLISTTAYATRSAARRGCSSRLLCGAIAQ